MADAAPGPLPPPLAAEDHVCHRCDLAYSEVSVGRAAHEVAATPARMRGAVAGVGAEPAATRPDTVTWSVVEYVCHLRDVYATSVLRLHWALVGSSVHVEPMFNEVRAARFRYQQRPLPLMLDELAIAATALCDEVAVVRADQWDSIIERLPGERRTARWLVRHAMHEGIHHVADVEEVVRRVRRGGA